jgi:alpha-L-rhamnosidase
MSGRLAVTRLRCDYLVDPLGIQSDPPLLSWELASDRRNQRQTAWRIQVASAPEGLVADAADLWDSGVVSSSETAQIPYGGLRLASRTTAWWRVRSWDGDGEPSDWSEIARWETGLLRAEDWSARWASLPLPPNAPLPGGVNEGLDALTPAPLLRRSFSVDRPVRRARLYATARGVYEPRINGTLVGDRALAPGWTDYSRRQAYQVFDVTATITPGENVVGATLAPGWFAGYVGWGERARHYGTEPQLLVQLEIDHEDGSREIVVTDGSWRGSDGPVRYGDLLMGEYHDARRARTGWDRAGFDDSGWQPVRLSGLNATPLVGDLAEPVRALELLPSIAMTTIDEGTVIHDLGQNLTGWARLEVHGPAGAVVRLRFGERLTDDGRLYVENLRRARATDTYVLAGTGPEVWEPRFTFHGFQYIEISGDPNVIATATVSGRFVGSATTTAGTFVCSSEDVNQLARNIVWGQRDNFLSIPTDCPQRDERLGWLGDAQVFVRTATTNMDVAAFFRKWMVDVLDAQRDDGAFPDVAPRLGTLNASAPAWADCGVIVPWTLWQVYGDTRVIDESWPAMSRYLAYLERRNPDGLWVDDRGNDYGDWLSIDAETSKELIGTAFWAYDASLMGAMARATGRHIEADRYDRLFRWLADAFVAAYVADDGRIIGDTQTAYLLPLHFGLLPEDLATRAVEHLVANIRARGNRLTTGFVSVAYLCPVLTAAGRPDIAFDLLFQDRFPSWLYPIRQGATTIWERWDGWTEADGFQDVGMNSFNHYSLGSVGEWLYRTVAGIDNDPAVPGFARVRIAPIPDHRLDWVRATYHGIRGSIASHWERTAGGLHLAVEIPANSTAEIVIPNSEGATVRESGSEISISETNGVIAVREGDGSTVVTIGSGSYRFTVG